jgi:hypothetical protein
MKSENLYESWKKQRSKVPVPDDFTDRVMASIHEMRDAAAPADQTDRTPEQKSRINTPSRSRRIMHRLTLFTTTTALLAAIYFGISFFVSERDSNIVFADVCKEIEKQIDAAKTITWKVLYYDKHTSKDGTRSWIDIQTNAHAYKAPGLYRDFLSNVSEVHSITIEDEVNGKKLKLNPREKKAELFILGKPTSIHTLGQDCFAHLSYVITSDTHAQCLGKMEIDGRQATGFRIIDNGESRDFWFDAKTKRLVMIREPGLDQYDPDKDPIRFNPPELSHSEERIMGCVYKDFVYDLKLDESLFSLDPPQGYTVKTYYRAEITEKDLLEWLGVFAEYYGRKFPDDVMQYLPRAEDLNRISKKQAKDRTPTERKILDRHRSNSDIVYPYPIHRFVQHTAKDTWRYLGKGVKLGDKDAVVCWYRLKDAKDPKTYRVVYGDLSVKDVREEDLPLPVGQ